MSGSRERYEASLAQAETRAARLDKTIAKLQEKIAHQAETIRELTDKNQAYHVQLQEAGLLDAAAPSAGQAQEGGSYFVARLGELSAAGGICLVGGSDEWQSKMQEVFPDLAVTNNLNFASDWLHQAQWLIINTNNTGHSLTKKASNLAAGLGIKIIYISAYNIKRVARDIVTQIETKTSQPG
jgi:uncharacterized coiled-coil protein SlyX